MQIADLGAGANQTGVRAHNERVVLSLVRRHGTLSKAEIARLSGLSAQTVTIMMRRLEAEGLLSRGAPVRGKVGQPSVPMSLNPDGAMSLGMKIGRRSVDLVLMDFTGQVRSQLRETYAYPEPAAILAFAQRGTTALCADLDKRLRTRVAGLGVAMPFEIWNWSDALGVSPDALAGWRDIDVVDALRAACALPVYLQNDGTAACGAEFLFGHGRETATYAYFFVASFTGGGVVLDGKLISGPHGNAGAFGTIRVAGPDGRRSPLLDCASLRVLEQAVAAAGDSPATLWDNPDDWQVIGPVLDRWITRTADYLSEAMLSACSVIDFETVIIDGNMPADVRSALLEATRAALSRQDTRGIRPFRLRPGSLGHQAQVVGGASLPIIAKYLVDTSVLLKDVAPA